jgi:hypothetical protein
MQVGTSKLRNVFGEASKQKYEDVKPHDTSTEGSLIDVNNHFVAVRKIFANILIRSLGHHLEEELSLFSMQETSKD